MNSLTQRPPILQPKPLKMPETVKNHNLDKALDAYQSTVWGNEDALPDEDVYRLSPGGCAFVLSKTKNRHTGRRNRYDLHFCLTQCVTGERQKVNDCGCQAGFSDGACRHAVAVDTLANAPCLQSLFLHHGEVRFAHRVLGTCPNCGAAPDLKADKWPLMKGIAYLPTPLPGDLGSGYSFFRLCGECGWGEGAPQ